MGGQLPSLTPQQVVKALRKLGFTVLRQKGSHLILQKPNSGYLVVIPMHKGKDIKKHLLLKILKKEAHISIEEFKKYL